MSIVRWGHFSDLHFQFGKNEFKTEDLREKLLERISEYRKKNGSFHYLFITGDILHKGNMQKHVISDTAEYIRQLAKAAGCLDKNVIICAGNHDLRRSKARKNNLDLIIKDYEENNCLDYNGYCSVVVNDVCSPFRDFCKFINAREEIKPLHYFIDLGKINLYVLNTSVFAGQTYPGQKDPNPKLEDTNLYICDQNLSELKKNVISDRKRKLNIVLAHHGIECFVEREREQFLNFLKDLDIDLYLCGHVHKSIYQTFDAAGEMKQCSCGGLFVDNYNAPSFIVGEYNDENHQIMLKNYQYIIDVASWRSSNSLNHPYDEKGEVKWIPKRFWEKSSSQKLVLNSEDSEEKTDSVIMKYKGIRRVSTGLDRDKEFIEIRERAKKSITILGVGMSKFSKYALHGSHSLRTLAQKMDVHLIMYDPEILEKNQEFAEMMEDFFGIGHFAENVRTAYNTLVEYCDKHNKNPANKYKITLYTYTTIPTMSAVIIDEEYEYGEIVLEYFGYHCGQNRPLFVINRLKEDCLFDYIREQINMLKENKCQVVTK